MANFFSRLGSIVAAVEKHPMSSIGLSVQWGLAKIRDDQSAANTAASTFGKQIAKDNTNAGVVGALTGALMMPYREIINRPIGTAFGVARRSAFNGTGASEFTNLNSWRQAYNETDKFSMGQQWARAEYADDIAGMAKDEGVSAPTLISQLRKQAQDKQNAALAPFLDTNGNLGTDVDPETAKEALAKAAGESDLYDPTASDAELLNDFKYNPALKYASGAMDVASSISLDPLNLVGGAVNKGVVKATTITKGEEADNALKALNGADLSDLSRSDRRAATKTSDKLDKLIKGTDGQTITQLANSTWARSTNDASSVAALFSDANKIEDPAARWAAKRDIISVGLGNQKALDGLAENSAALRATYERLSSPIEVTDAPVWRQGSDGSDVLNWWNSTSRLDENKAMMPQISAELDRMEQLQNIALSTNRIAGAYSPGERVAQGLRNQRTYETIVRRSPLARPIRLVTGPTARMAQGYVNVKDGTAGFDQLRDTLHRSKYLTSDVKEGLLSDYLSAASTPGRQLVVKKAEQAIWDAHTDAHGLDADAVNAFKAQALGKRSSYINMLSRLYSASDQAPKAVVRAIDEEGVEHAIPIAFLKTHLEDAEALTDPRALERAFGRVAPGNLWQAFDKRTGRFGDVAEDVLNHGTQVWKDLALFRGAYPLRIQMDTQLRLMAVMRGQYLVTAFNGMGDMLNNWVTRSTVEDVEDLAAKTAAQAKLDRALARQRELRATPAPTTQVGPQGLSREEFEATGTDLLHGTVQKFDRFESGAGTNRKGQQRTNMAGDEPSLYFTDKPHVAKHFGDHQAFKDWDPEELMQKFSTQDETEFSKNVENWFREQIKKSDDVVSRRDPATDEWAQVSPDTITADEIMEGPGGDLRLQKNGVTPRVIKTKVYGKTLDLTDFDKIPADLREAMFGAKSKMAKSYDSDGRIAARYRDPEELQRHLYGYFGWSDHEYNPDLLKYMREHGYGKAQVKDTHESGYVSTIGLPEYSDYGRDPYAELSQAATDPAAEAARSKELSDLRAEIGRHQRRVAQPTRTITGRTGKVAKRRLGDRQLTHNGVPINPIRRTVDENGVVQNQGNLDREYLDRYLATDNAQALAGMDIADRTLAELRANGNWDVTHGGEPTWARDYLRAVNQQLRNSPTAMRVLQGGSMSEIRHDVLNDGKMLAEWRFAHGAGNEDIDAWIHSIHGEWDRLATHPEIRAAVVNRPLTVNDLRTHYQDVTARPTVHGEGYSVLDKGPFAQAHTNLRNWWYKKVSDIPEQAMGRHPLFVHNFQSRMRTMLDQYGHEAGQELDNHVLELMRRNAMNGAKKDIAKVLFDTTGRTNLAHAVRFVSPFYAAWEDTMTKWGRILASDPRNLNDLNKVWTAPDDAGITSKDQNGNTVVMIPKYLSVPGIGTSRWVIPKGSFNIVFQGSDWWMPGFGPLIQAAANEGAKHFFADLADTKIGKALLPYGVEDRGIADEFLPAWVKRARSALNSNDPDYMKTYNMLAAQEDSLYKAGKRNTPPDTDEIKRRTRNWYIARAAAANLMPFSGQPQPVLQFYMDKAKEYRNTYGDNWQEQYYQDFPQYYEMTLGLTTNETGIVATDRAYNAAKKYKSQIADDPTYGWYFVGADNTYSNDPGSDRYFSQGVYASQEASGMLKKKAPGEAVKDAQVSQGWLEYNQGMTYLRTQLEARGLKTFTAKKASDLKDQKDAFLEELKGENRAWADAYDAGGSSDKIGAFLRMADQYTANDSKLAARPDNQALAQWVQSRREVKAALASRKSQSIDDPSNADLAEAWETAQGELVASDIGFEQMYNRVLARDDLSGDY